MSTRLPLFEADDLPLLVNYIAATEALIASLTPPALRSLKTSTAWAALEMCREQLLKKQGGEL